MKATSSFRYVSEAIKKFLKNSLCINVYAIYKSENKEERVT